MKRIAKVLCAAAVLIMAQPSAAQVPEYKAKDQFGLAIWSSLDNPGAVCPVETYVRLVAASSSVKVDEKGFFSGVILLIRQQETCTGRNLLEAVGDIALVGEALIFKNHLSGATLRTSAEVIDRVSGIRKNVWISVPWKGVGETLKGPADSLILQGYCLSLCTKADGFWRKATVTGAVITDGITNFAPFPASYAELAEAKSRVK